MAKEKQYVSDNARLMKEWDWEKNNALSFYPNLITVGSDKKVWWICEKGHSFRASISNRVGLNRGCPYCANKKVLIGYNDLATVNPTLAKEWHPTKNRDLSPSDVLSGTAQKVWWQCAYGHEWQASIVNRHKKSSGCPYCSHLLPIEGKTDFATQYPQIAKEWHPTKNDSLSPSSILPGSDKVVWWMCEQGHEWQAPVKRCLKNQGCPYCSGRKPIEGKNDLQSQNPFLANEWNQSKNGLLASEVSIRSGIKYWWTCSKCGFEWQATPHNRTNGALGTGCPQCAKETQTSYPEQVVFHFISKHYPDAINRYTDTFLERMELDIYIPSLKIGIEYDGIAWHSSDETKKREHKKYLACKKQGVFLIRIREDADESSNADCNQLIKIKRHPSNQELYRVLQVLSEYVSMDDDFAIDSVEQTIRASYVVQQKEKSLAVAYPNIIKYWCFDKNQDVSPENISVGSKYRAWWICEKGHEWQAVVSAMVQNRNKYPTKTGCPYCANQKIWIGFNDLPTTNPTLASEWHPTLNETLLPTMVTKGSNKKVWWRCSEGHEWQALVSSRNKGNGCPRCARQKRKK